MAQVRLAQVTALTGGPRVRVAGGVVSFLTAGKVRVAGVMATTTTGPQIRIAGVTAATSTTGSGGRVRVSAALASTLGPIVRVAYIDAGTFDGSFTLPRLTANAGADTSAFPFDTVTLNGAASENLDGPVAYQWTQTGGAAVDIASAGSAAPTITAPATVAGTTATFQLTASDGTGATRTDTVTVTVPAHNLFLIDTDGTPIPLRITQL